MADCDEVVQDEMAVSCTVVVDGEVGHCGMADCDEVVHVGMAVSYTYADDEDDHCGKEGSCNVVVGREIVHHTCVAAVGFYLVLDSGSGDDTPEEVVSGIAVLVAVVVPDALGKNDLLDFAAVFAFSCDVDVFLTFHIALSALLHRSSTVVFELTFYAVVLISDINLY